MENVYFDDLFQMISLDAKSPEQTNQDVNFIEQYCSLDSESRILDLGCGVGRHSIAFAKLGYSVVGLDNNQQYLEVAKKRSEEGQVKVEWKLGNDLQLDYKNHFDLILSLFTSFGYHDDHENEMVIQKISQALKPGGHFVLEITNRDPVAVLEKITKINKMAPLMVIKENTFDLTSSRRNMEWTFIENNQIVRKTVFSHRLYSPHELINLFKQHNLNLVNIFQDTKCTAFIPDAKKIVLIARKPLIDLADKNLKGLKQ